MVKTLHENSTYEPAKWSFKWLKVKKDYIESNGLGDSFDLVVVGGVYGKGKRTGKFGTFLMAAYNPDLCQYETCTLIGTGFSDADLDTFYDYFKDWIIDNWPSNVLIESETKIDVWFEPDLVWEVKAADI